MNELPQELIERALALCDKSMADMEIWAEHIRENIWKNGIFSIEKFFYYILDRQFLIKYYQNNRTWYTPNVAKTDLMAWEFWYAIMEYQSWNSEPIISLLTKIWTTKK